MTDFHFMTIFILLSNTDLKLRHFDLAKTLGISQELNACAVKILMLKLKSLHLIVLQEDSGR